MKKLPDNQRDIYREILPLIQKSFSYVEETPNAITFNTDVAKNALPLTFFPEHWDEALRKFFMQHCAREAQDYINYVYLSDSSLVKKIVALHVTRGLMLIDMEEGARLIESAYLPPTVGGVQ